MTEPIDQNGIDALLNDAQTQADSLSAQAAGEPTGATPGDIAVIDQAGGMMDQIAGDMAPPGAKTVDAQSLAGDFDAPAAIPGKSAAKSGDLTRLLSIEVPVIVLLGQRRMTVGEVMRLGVGAIVEFSKSAEEELDLLVNNKTVGKGHAVKVGENFGIKLASVGDLRETIKKLGA